MKFGSQADDVWLIKLMTWNFVTARYHLERELANFAEKILNYNFYLSSNITTWLRSLSDINLEEQINTRTGDVMEHCDSNKKNERVPSFATLFNLIKKFKEEV